MNKKGDAGNQFLSFVFLLLLFIIGVGIFSGVALFFGNGYDGRDLDVRILGLDVKSCIIEKGVEGIETDFYPRCRLNEEVILQSYGIKICVDRGDCLKEEGIFQSVGDFESCQFNVDRRNGKYAKCFFQNNLIIEGRKIDILVKANQDVTK